MIEALQAIDLDQALKALGALYAAVLAFLAASHLILIIVLRPIARATVTDSDDKAIDGVISRIESAQRFVARWGGRLSLAPKEEPASTPKVKG